MKSTKFLRNALNVISKSIAACESASAEGFASLSAIPADNMETRKRVSYEANNYKRSEERTNSASTSHAEEMEVFLNLLKDETNAKFAESVNLNVSAFCTLAKYSKRKLNAILPSLARNVIPENTKRGDVNALALFDIIAKRGIWNISRREIQTFLSHPTHTQAGYIQKFWSEMLGLKIAEDSDSRFVNLRDSKDHPLVAHVAKMYGIASASAEESAEESAESAQESAEQ